MPNSSIKITSYINSSSHTSSAPYGNSSNNDTGLPYIEDDSTKYTASDVSGMTTSQKKHIIKKLWDATHYAPAINKNQIFDRNELKKILETSDAIWYICGKSIKLPNFNDNYWVNTYYDNANGIGAMDEVITAYQNKINLEIYDSFHM